MFDYDYDPTAECPVFEAALTNMFADKSDVDDVKRHVLEIMGYSLSSYKNIAACVALVGGGGNGKTVLLNALKNLTSGYALNVSISALENRFTLSKMLGKRVVIDDDFAVGKQLPNEIIKKISEIKVVEAEQKFKDGFEFTNQAICWLASNSWPYTGDTTNSIIRRMHFIGFDVTFDETNSDVRINDKIKKETPGIFNLVIKHLERFRQRGKFKKPKSVEDARRRWNQSTNIAAAFMSDYAEQGHRDAYVGIMALYSYYREWCGESGHKVCSRLAFKKMVEELGVKESTRGMLIPNQYINFDFLEKTIDDHCGELHIYDLEAAYEDNYGEYSHKHILDYCIKKGYKVKQRGRKVSFIDAT
jgi:putative DNA primase/helicase